LIPKFAQEVAIITQAVLKMNILITSAGRRVSLVKAFREELKKVFPEGKVITSDAEPLLAAACHVSDAYFEVPRLRDKSYMEILVRKCRELSVNLIIPTIDTELLLLAQHKCLLEENNIQVVISSTDFVNQCRDKRVIHEFFESHGIDVAHEYSKDDFKLPIFIKPLDGSRSVDTFIIKRKEQLREFHFTNKKLMFLQYLDQDLHDEYTCDLYYGRDHKLKCIVPRKRIEVRDGEVNKGLTVENEVMWLIRDRLSYIDGAVGCLTTQFFKEKEGSNIYGIEVNPRFDGGFPLTYLSGANYPKWIIQEYLLNEPVEADFDCWERNLLMLRYDDEILVHGYTG